MNENDNDIKELTMNELVSLCTRRGFIFPGSEIYGGLANTWDYGPLGVELKNNIKKAWWQKFIIEDSHNFGVDAAILMNPKTWIASGHVQSFSDPLIDCKECKTRHRADKLIEEWFQVKKEPTDVSSWSDQKLIDFIKENKITCPKCGKSNFTDIRKFNLMFKTFQGVTEDTKSEIYLRPETAQGIFVNFKNVLRSSRGKIPIGIGQIGKSFRNEITPGNFIFRVREFEQMELEFFCGPDTDLEWFDYWKSYAKNWLLSLGLKEHKIRLRDHSKEELSFYSRCTTDIEFSFPFGWGELWGIADRTDYDLKQHMEYSKEDLSYFDQELGKKYIPYCIEPSVGVERLVLAFLCSAYKEEKIADDDVRVILQLHPALAPFKACILPLTKKLSEASLQIYELLLKNFNVDYDDAGSIGKRYRRQDEIGTPYCITIDYDTETDQTITIRDRDTMKQERIKIGDLKEYIESHIKF